jgi:pantoate--beta-alanine ligase
MIIFKKAEALKKHLEKITKSAQSIGFVPTMGALHQGHLALIRESRQHCDVTVCSIFVNPVQFNDPKDFEKYPVTTENDILLLEEEGTDILFLPSVNEIYPGGLAGGIHYNIGYLENILEGHYRPGHFQGVCRVLHRLLDIVNPGSMFMGLKDYQQCMVVKRLLEEHNIPAQLKMVDTLRETGGLAMSSRNLRLSPAARQKALAIYHALTYIKHNIAAFTVERLRQQATRIIIEGGFEKIDYVAICHAGTLQPAGDADKNAPLVALVAAFIDGIRLIDNMLVG